MYTSVFAWVGDHKESFTVLCATLGGAFALVKWIWPTPKRQQTMESSSGAESTAVAVGAGATVIGGVIAGSHNTQSVVINHNLPIPPEIPIHMRKSSTPTGNEIRQRENELVKGIPLAMRQEVHQKYLDNIRGLAVAWPIRIYGVYPRKQTGVVTIDGRYGTEEWGAFVRFDVQGSEYPILNTVEEGHHAFIQGRICEINEWVIEIETSKLEFE